MPLTRSDVPGLTEREHQVLALIWEGFKNREIGEQLKISVKTVEAHRAAIMKKLRVSNAASSCGPPSTTVLSGCDEPLRTAA